VMQEFLMHFAKKHSFFTERQLRRFGDWISKAVAVDGDIENAVSTCFLEHTRQVKINECLHLTYHLWRRPNHMPNQRLETDLRARSHCSRAVASQP
jgi:hypothetical protein